MPHSKKEGVLLSLIMSLIMIYVMVALNNDVKMEAFSASSWKLALERLPLGYLVGILCDLCICTPLSRKIVSAISQTGDRELYQVFVLRFYMVVLMTMILSGETGSFFGSVLLLALEKLIHLSQKKN